jgi:predicted transcriptional regulator
MRRPTYHKLLRPSPKVEKYLGRLEAAVMEVLWDRGQASVREVLDALRGDRTMAYTTVMTVMVRLADKGLLERQTDGRMYRYWAAATREEFLSGVSRRVIDDLIEDFGDVAMAQFLDVLDGVDPERLRTLRQLAHARQVQTDDG